MPNFTFTVPNVVTYVYNQSLGTVVSYLNGVYQATATPGSSYPLTGTAFVVGSQGTSIEGTMDEFRMYNRALTVTEILQVWNKTLPINQAPNNAGVSALTAPVNFAPGLQDIKVKVANKGSNRIDSVRVNWSLNGVVQTPVYWTSPLDTFSGPTYPNDTIITLGSTTFTNGISKTLVAWTSFPNGVADTITNDDSITVVLQSSLSGNFTIGGTSPDYATISDAVNALGNFGIYGPVNFSIRTGTYNGQLLFGNIAGSSEINTITFRSQANHRDSVVVNYTSTIASSGVVNFTSTSYVTFRAVTFNQTGTTASSTVYVTGTAVKDTFDNCKITSAASSTSGTYAVYATSAGINGLVLKNNLITGGYYGLYLYGASTTSLATNCVVDGNTIMNAYYYSYYIYYNCRVKFRNNVVTPLATSATHYYYFYYADSSSEYTGNKINLQNTTNYMYLYYFRNGANDRSYIANNTFSGGTSSTAVYIYMGVGSSNLGIYHNSFNLNHSSGVGPTIYNSIANGIDVKNNAFANNSTGYAASFYYAPSTYAVASDYNNFYSNGTVLINQVSPAATYANLPAWRATYGLQEKNSISYRPGYTSATNLMPNPTDSACWSLNGRGIYLTPAIAATDLNGMPRPATRAEGVPDIGAYEFTPTSLPPVASMVAGPAITGYINQVYLFGGDTIAKLAFDNTNGAPAFVHLRRKTGTVPPLVGSMATNHMNFYDSIYAPSGTYSYNMEMYYKDAWLGTMTDEGNMTIIKNLNPATSSWSLTSFSPTVDSANNKITALYLSDFGVFAGTDVLAPLPVKLLSLTAAATSKSVHVSWVTASEKNSAYFVVERSTDGKTFEVIAKIKAAGNSESYQKYAFDDADGKTMLSKGMLYYRLAAYDVNGKAEHSKIVTVNEKTKTDKGIKLYPNPFVNELVLELDMDLTGPVEMEIADINGKQVYQHQFNNDTQIITNLEQLTAGIYFVKITVGDEVKVLKLMK